MRRFTVYDSLSRETRMFVPITPPKVGMFVCGLTPYDDAHIGHGRTAVLFDVVARALSHWGYRVHYIQNVTNIDDRLIARGAETGIDPLRLADRHFLAYRVAMEQLGVRSVNYYPHATDYLPEIVQQIRTLLEKGYAYESRGSVYFEAAKFRTYGRLSGQRLEEARPGTRVEPEPGKRAPEDFVLWKAARPGEPSWEAPWGPGRPGWHIEDTAITASILGPRYDLHGGGLDLKFPHHEAEIAQAEGASGLAPLANIWMHAGMLQFHGEKMSKSLGNVVPLQDAIQKHGPMVLRFYYLNAQYRSPLDYSGEATLREASEAYDRLDAPSERLREAVDQRGPDHPGQELPEEVLASSNHLLEQLDELLASDFATREAIAALFGWSRTVNEWLPRFESLSGPSLSALAAPYRWAQEVLGLFEGRGSGQDSERIAPAVQVAIEARQRARDRGDFEEADRLRESLRSAGILLEDNGSLTRWRFAPGEAG
ncbi:MAG: cysteine--tRNA ligase [Thermoplasmata archaeon]|nr:cysteine--tRNA ligase [Thermoplasmata archaeon]MCI4358971.1 cysteine--tRNA ligase [Thermoplasmata archaeon]